MRGQDSLLRNRGIAFLAAACICTLLAGCGQAAETEEEVMSEVIPVQVQQPEAGTLTLQNEFVGTISPEESVYVIPMVSAEVVSTNVSVGDEVKAGDVLCKLDDEAARLQLASAQAQYDSAAAGVNSAEVGYEMAQAQYDSTAAQLDAQMGGQKNLQMYQLQIQKETVESAIDDIYEQQADLAEQKKDAEDAMDAMESNAAQLQKQYNAAQAEYYFYQQVVTIFDTGTDEQKQYAMTLLGEHTGKTYQITDVDTATQEAKTNLLVASDAFDQVKNLYEPMASASAQAQAGIDSIEDGQKQLDDSLANAYKQLEQAEAVMNITEEQVYEDTQKVVDANKKAAALGINSAEAGVNSAKVGMEGAQVAVDSAEYQLDMYTLTAPIDGVIEAVNVNEHDFASTGTPAYVISNKGAMTVTFYVSEGIRNTLTTGQKISVDRNGKLYSAAITEIGSMVDQNTGLFQIKASVSGSDESLLTGCSVKVTVDTYSQDDAILIPYDAVYYDDSQSYVYVAAGDTVERRDIETGIFDEQTITVLSGLTTEDQLITSWSANLRDGAKISIQSAQDDGTGGEEQEGAQE